MQTYTRKEIVKILGISPRAFVEREKALNLNPSKGERGAKLYSDSDLDLFKQQHEHLKNKFNTLNNFVPSTAVEIVPTTRNLPVVPDNFAEAFAIGKQQDLLFDLELLQRISDRRWLMDTRKLAVIFGISPRTLSRYQVYSYFGFVASREIKDKNKVWWKVEANDG